MYGVFRPGGASSSGQVISPPLGPSGGPFMTYLLPGGGVQGQGIAEDYMHECAYRYGRKRVRSQVTHRRND